MSKLRCGNVCQPPQQLCVHAVYCIKHVTSGEYSIDSVQLQRRINGTKWRAVLCVPGGQVQGLVWERCLRRLRGRQVLHWDWAEQLDDVSELLGGQVLYCHRAEQLSDVSGLSCTKHVASGQ